jgi:hypothetical protein
MRFLEVVARVDRARRMKSVWGGSVAWYVSVCE